MLNFSCTKAFLFITFFFFNSCSNVDNKFAKKFDLKKNELQFLEKFFRYFFCYESAIYTLEGPKPITQATVVYYDYEKLSDQEKKRSHHKLNKDNSEHMKFYETLSKEEKKHTVLISDKDFIFDDSFMWDQWEKMSHKIPISNKYIFHSKERDREKMKTIYPEYEKIVDVYLVNILNTALMIEENYDLFKRYIGFDFDPLTVTLEFGNPNSKFWAVISGKDAYNYSSLWGLLFGFGRKNSVCYLWKSRHLKESEPSKKEIAFSKTMKRKFSDVSYRNSKKDSYYAIDDFPIPAFASFSEEDPIIKKYELEKSKIQKKYKSKDFVQAILEKLSS